jgi:hypothetical protein
MTAWVRDAGVRAPAMISRAAVVLAWSALMVLLAASCQREEPPAQAHEEYYFLFAERTVGPFMTNEACTRIRADAAARRATAAPSTAASPTPR